MYDVVNALSFLTSHQPTIQTRYKMMKEVPGLLKKLNEKLG